MLWWNSIAVVSLGAVFGAILRWLLQMWLNTVFPLIPLGTLAANLIGGYLIGLAVGIFALYPIWGANYSLLVITGFLGSLTTFSSFSIEVVSLLQKGYILSAMGLIALHVVGSLGMTFLGLLSVNLFTQSN